MAVVIERLDRWGHTLDTCVLEGEAVTIGRAYDSDYLLRDPFIDGHHLRIECPEPGQFLVTDLGTLNGTCVRQGKERQFVSGTRTRIAAGGSVHLGKTRLRLLNAEETVEPALKLSESPWLSNAFGSWWLVLVSSGLALLATVASQFMAEPFAENWYGGIFAGFAYIVAALAYGSVWTGVARAQGKDMRFLWHTNFALLALIAVELLTLVQPILRFNFEWLFVADSLVVVICLMLFALLLASTLMATRLSPWKGGLVAAALPLLLGGMLLTRALNLPDFSASPDYRLTLVSPAFQWRGAIEQSDFLERTQRLYRVPESRETADLSR